MIWSYERFSKLTATKGGVTFNRYDDIITNIEYTILEK